MISVSEGFSVCENNGTEITANNKDKMTRIMN